jgi:hypothetical protein
VLGCMFLNREMKFLNSSFTPGVLLSLRLDQLNPYTKRVKMCRLVYGIKIVRQLA